MMRMHRKCVSFILLSLIWMGILSLSACGKTENQVPDNAKGKEVLQQMMEENTEEESVAVEKLGKKNELPEDGIITKAQLETVAGKKKKISFHGVDDSGIEYTWTFACNQIQNPEDQNLKIDFQTEDLEDLKEEANHANDALVMTMHGKGLVCVPTLEVILPESWKSDTVLLLKEQNDKLAKMSDVTIESKPKAEKEEKEDKSTDPVEGTTRLVMHVTSLDGDCYLVGGIANVQDTTASSNQTENMQENKASYENGNQNVDNSGGNYDNGDVQDYANDESGDIANDQVEDTAHYCTISISCNTILNNMANLTAGKEEFVPANGWILQSSEVEYSEGESVHDVLKRVCQQAGIHMESSYSAVYDSAYVEGINQLYEFDCGELSGWMYSVNGWFPNYGCSKYFVQDGDVINWVYTCDLGKDVGDNSMY